MTDIVFNRPKAYRFDLVTKEYRGEVRPTICPASLDNDRVQFLFPGDSTYVAPPESPAAHKAVWDGVQWRLEQDHRGETWFNGATPVQITALGDPSALGLVREPIVPPPPPPDPIAERKRELLARLTEITTVGSSFVALNKAAPAHIIDEQVEIVNELRKLDEARK